MMHQPLRLALCATVFLSLLWTGPADAQKATSAYSDVALLSETTSIKPGSIAWVGLHIKTKPGWHTYWQNPGDSGAATRIKWTLPEGLSTGEIQWPVPVAFKTGPVTSYGYKEEVLLMVPLAIDQRVRIGAPADITAQAAWLVCDDICVPEKAVFKLSLPISPFAIGAKKDLFAAQRRALPAGPAIRAQGTQLKDRIGISVRVPGQNWHQADKLEFFPVTEGALDAAAPQTVTYENGSLSITAKPGFIAEEEKLTVVEGVLVVQSRIGSKTDRKGFKLSAKFQPNA